MVEARNIEAAGEDGHAPLKRGRSRQAIAIRTRRGKAPVYAGGFFIHLASACGDPNAGLYDIGIEHALSMPIERPQSRDARELDRAATFGRARYQLRCCEDDPRATFG